MAQQVIASAVHGDNSDLLPMALQLYVPEGSKVWDVTWGHGTFWKKVDLTKYALTASDLNPEMPELPGKESMVTFLRGPTDLQRLPFMGLPGYDALVLDPPYMSDSNNEGELIADWYRNENGTHQSVMRLYAGGILEAARVLRKHGRILVKTQDEVSGRRQRFTHIEIIQLLEILGFWTLDLFVLMRFAPPRQRNKVQVTARKNHSYLIVAELRN